MFGNDGGFSSNGSERPEAEPSAFTLVWSKHKKEKRETYIPNSKLKKENHKSFSNMLYNRHNFQMYLFLSSFDFWRVFLC